MAKVLAIIAHKGGVGKTTSVASIGGILADRFNQRVLLVDMDAQRNLTRTFVNPENVERGTYDLFSVLETHQVPDVPVLNLRKNLDLIPSTKKMLSLEKNFAAEPGREYPLKLALDSISSEYDWILVDTPTNLGIATSNAVAAADYVLIPMCCDAYSADSFSSSNDIIETIKMFINPKVKLLGVFKTMFDERRVADKIISKEMEKNLEGLIMNTSIRECRALVNGAAVEMDIVVFDPKSNGAADYTELAKEIIEKTGGDA